LRGSEEHPQDNINKTYYRDQINKVANGIKDIISALKNQNEPQIFPIETTGNEVNKSKPVNPKKIIVAFIAVLLFASIYVIIPKHSGSSEPLEMTLAVLPFEKWFSNKDFSYLGDAVASQINSQLRAIKAFNIISFNSTRRYTAPDIPHMKQISKECGANILVQGSVELSKDNKDVTINVQLINTKTNNPIWDEKFRGELDSLQIIRSRIIIKIARELHIVLSDEEIKQIETGLTKSSDAYKNFLSANYQDEAASLALMGKKYQDSISLEQAIKMYDKAIEYDSTFAMAYARRSISRSYAIFSGILPGPGNIEKCKADIDKALKLVPKLPEGMNALGFYYYYCKNDFQKALECFKQASEIDPGNWQPLFYMAMVYRRTGEWTKSKSLLYKVLKYNPQDALILTNIGFTYSFLRDYDSALLYHDMAIRAMPNWTAPYINKISTLLIKDGTTRESRICIDSATKRTGNRFQKERILFDIYDSNFNDALIKTELSDQADFKDQGEKLLEFATIHNYLNHSNLAKTYFDSSLVFLNRKLKANKDDPTYLIQIGRAYAGLKNSAKAIESGEKAVRITTDVIKNSDRKIELAEIYISCGEYSKGIKQIDELLNEPSNLSVRFLSLDPVWKPILKNGEYQKVIEKHTTK
jgi:tetratricopeptide (TPR) repeat protein